MYRASNLHPGYVHLKRHQVINCSGCEQLRRYFDSQDFLLCDLVNESFKATLITILHSSSLWSKVHGLELLGVTDSLQFLTTLKIRVTQIGGCYYPLAVSIDIVPTLHIDGWWPDNARQDVDEELKRTGCRLIFVTPDDFSECYVPWTVLYYKPLARISFSVAESELISRSPQVVKDCLRIAKFRVQRLNLPGCVAKTDWKVRRGW